MSYVDDKATGSKLTSALLVLLMITLFGYGFIQALSVKSLKEMVQDLNAFDVVEEPPPPPDEPPPPPPDQPEPSQPPIVTPPPLVRVNTPPPPIQTTETPPPPSPPRPVPPAPPGPTAAPPPPPPPPSPPAVAKKAVQRSQGITNDDYPAAAVRAEAEGVTSVRYTIDASGRATNCSVTKSSGNGVLDSTTCSLIERRFRFTPAQDAAGNKIPETRSQSIRWQLPED